MDENIVQEQISPKSFTTTTPFLRYLALILFILLPFIGFYLGMQYQKTISVDLPQQFEKNILETTITASPTQVSNERQQTCEEMSPDVSGVVSNSTNDGMCTVTVPYVGYSFDYPVSWETATVGAAAINMSFSNSELDNFMYLYITSADDLTLENAYLATICYECLEPDPLITKGEVIVTKEVIQYGSNKVLHVRTQKNDVELSKYFIVNDMPNDESSIVYMFDLHTDSEETTNQAKQLLETFTIFEQ